VLNGEETATNCIVFSFTRWGWSPRYTPIEASKLTYEVLFMINYSLNTTDLRLNNNLKIS